MGLIFFPFDFEIFYSDIAYLFWAIEVELFWDVIRCLVIFPELLPLLYIFVRCSLFSITRLLYVYLAMATPSRVIYMRKNNMIIPSVQHTVHQYNDTTYILLTRFSGSETICPRQIHLWSFWLIVCSWGSLGTHPKKPAQATAGVLGLGFLDFGPRMSFRNE